ncbi:MAG: hypothetical protein AVDCRST_MAG33-439, partial [uncultured Thermomicrobiales bacterium]
CTPCLVSRARLSAGQRPNRSPSPPDPDGRYGTRPGRSSQYG